MRKFIDKCMSAIEQCFNWLAVVMFIVIFFAAMAQIVMRWIFNNPFTWSEELIRLLFVWICFLGWTFASKHRTHIQITAVINRLPSVGQKLLATFNILLTILFSVLLVVYGIEMTKRGASMKAVSLPGVNFAMVYVACPVCNVVICIYEILKIFDLWVPKAEVKGASV
ncbi:MAG: TRAP transporter small permease [Sphaerochaetaceae bacterium]|nr:TRAP transporter small permease [Spirochaetales bacterium]MDY5499296.1 TRAP transporter small permease [Sphaerochaetaceae bacterium]